MKIYVGNLSYETTEDDLKKEFEAFGKVASVSIIKDRDTGQPRGFAFVDMPTDSEAQAAITGMKDKQIGGRSVVVNESKPRENRPSGGGGFGGGRGGSGGDFGGGRGGRR
jgi:RNA recognition motif-containing protein